MKNQEYINLIPFNDASLPNQQGRAISIEKSEYLEKTIMPQLLIEVEKLRKTHSHLLPKKN
jgi:hypothetical protein